MKAFHCFYHLYWVHNCECQRADLKRHLWCYFSKHKPDQLRFSCLCALNTFCCPSTICIWSTQDFDPAYGLPLESKAWTTNMCRISSVCKSDVKWGGRWCVKPIYCGLKISAFGSCCQTDQHPSHNTLLSVSLDSLLCIRELDRIPRNDFWKCVETIHYNTFMFSATRHFEDYVRIQFGIPGCQLGCHISWN